MLCGADGDLDGADAIEAGREPPRRRSRQRRNAGGAGDNRNPGGSGLSLQRADPRNEVARIGEIHVGDGLDACARQMVAASLKRTSRVDHEIGRVSGKQRRDLRTSVRSDRLGARERGTESFGVGEASPRDQNRVPARGKPSRQTRTKPAISAENENAAQRMYLLCSAAGIQHVSRCPKIR